MSIDVFELTDWHDTLLIARWSAFVRIGWTSTLSDQEVGWRLSLRLNQASTLGSLRECCGRWGIEVQGWTAPPSNLVARVVEAVRRRQLVAYALSPVEKVSLGADVAKARAAILLIKPARLLPQGASSAGSMLPSAAIMSLEQRLTEILDRTESRLAVLRSALSYGLLFEPAMFIKSVAVLALWAGTPLVTISHIMAAVLKAAPTTDINRIADQTADIAEFVEGVKIAWTDVAFEEAAKRLARIMEAIGPKSFADIMRIVPEKIIGGGSVKEVYVYPPMRTIVPPLQERPVANAKDQTPINRTTTQQSLTSDLSPSGDSTPTGKFEKVLHKVEQGPGSRLLMIVNKVNPLKGTQNCGYIIDAVVARVRGTDPNATAPLTQDGSFAAIASRFNTHFQEGGFEAAFDAVKAGGNGTIALIKVIYPVGPNGQQGSHVITMVNDNGKVGIVEAQDWGQGQGPEIITDPNRANHRYNPTGGSNIGFAILPAI